MEKKLILPVKPGKKVKIPLIIKIAVFFKKLFCKSPHIIDLRNHLQTERKYGILIDLPDTGVFSILNPYKNYRFFYKGQVHCHSIRGKEDGVEEEDPPRTARRVLEQYGQLGYHFVCLTDHDRKEQCCSPWLGCSTIFTDPNVPNVVYIPGQESGKTERTHMVEIGLTQQNPCRQGGDFDLRDSIEFVKRKGGITVAAHPNSDAHTWKDEELFNIPWLGGVEGNTEDWDKLLRNDRTRWIFRTDDSHITGDLNRGWLMVNSNFEHADKNDLVENMKNGNFFSISRPRAWDAYDGQLTEPHFDEITVNGNTINVTFSGCETIRFIGYRGLLLENSSFNDMSQANKESCTLYWPERYVRIELENSNGIKAFSQPLFVYGASIEDFIEFNYNTAKIGYSGGHFKIVVNNTNSLLDFGWNVGAALKALEIIQHYKMNKICYIGRPMVVETIYQDMTYFLSDNQAPTGSFPNEDALYFDPDNLEIKLVTNINLFRWEKSWKLIEKPDHVLFDFKDNEIQAHRALEVIKRYGFTYRCFVNRRRCPHSMTYLRK